jgi:AraC-like DNA-binding protein
MGYPRRMPADTALSIRYARLPFDGVEAMRACTARAFSRHTHDHTGIGLVDAGGHSSWSGRGQVEAGPGTFITVNPGEVHDGAAIGGRARAWRILYFEPDALAALRADVVEGDLAEFTFATPVFADASLRAAFESALGFGGAAGGADAARACEEALLTLAARLGAHSCARRAQCASSAPAVVRARQRIDADPMAPVSLRELAAEAGVSRFQLMRGFRKATGLAPHAYIVQRRLAVARRLLRAGHPPGDVAVLAGFYDQSHLGRCFIRQFGVAPARYALSS